jgi:hypothetical protein
MKVPKQMIGRFLSWKLPRDFRPDCHIYFDKEAADAFSDSWPYGTNLLTAAQAELLLEHVLDLNDIGTLSAWCAAHPESAAAIISGLTEPVSRSSAQTSKGVSDMPFAYESTGEKLRRVQEVNRALEARNQALQVELATAMKKVRELEAMQAQGSFERKAHPCATGETTWEEK